MPLIKRLGKEYKQVCNEPACACKDEKISTETKVEPLYSDKFEPYAITIKISPCTEERAKSIFEEVVEGLEYDIECDNIIKISLKKVKTICTAKGAPQAISKEEYINKLVVEQKKNMYPGYDDTYKQEKEDKAIEETEKEQDEEFFDNIITLISKGGKQDATQV